MRLFVGIPANRDIQEYAKELRAAFAPAKADLRWVPPENIHLTVEFLGEVNESRLPELKGLVDETAAAHHAFVAQTGRLGVFQSLENPRVLWVGVSEEEQRIHDLAQALKTRLQGRFHVEQRPFRAHATLARIRTKANWQRARLVLFERTRPAKVSRLPFIVDRLILYKSERGPDGSRYEPLHEARLRAPAPSP